MSRRSATTLTIELRLRLPPGSNTAEILDYVRAAVGNWKGGSDPVLPISSLDTNEMIVKLKKKETVYL